MLEKLSINLLFGTLLLVFFCTTAIAGDGPKCIGNICLDRNTLSVKQITRLLGPATNATGGDIAYYCYSVNPGAYLRIGFLRQDETVVSLLLSQSKSCIPMGASKLDISHLLTEKGLGLDSTSTHVKELYGEPVEIVGPEKAYKRWLSTDTGYYQRKGKIDELWIYGPSTNMSLARGFGIYKNHVVSVFLQDSP